MNRNDCIAYEGSFYTIEWYYNENGKSQSHEYYEILSNAQKRKLFQLFKRMGDFGKINDKTKFRYEGDDIFAFKPQPDRFLSFFVEGKKIILATGFKKKSQKLPKNEKEKATKYRKDFLKRNGEDKYYE